jgi:hypothetical protein
VGKVRVVLITINRLAAWITLGPYVLAVVIFAIFSSSGYTRGWSGIRAYFAFYFLYAAIYGCLAILLSKQASALPRFIFCLLGAACIVGGGYLAFYIGFLIGLLLLLTARFAGLGVDASFYASFLGVPIMGAVVGGLITLLIGKLGGWPKADHDVVRIRRLNVVTGGLVSCLAMYFGMQQDLGTGVSYGREYVASQFAMGLAGPLVHAIASLIPSARRPLEGGRLDARIGHEAYCALAGLMLVALLSLAAAIFLTDRWSENRLWTAQGLSNVLQSRAEINERRRPPTDGLIRMGTFIINRRPADLIEKFYDWKSERFLHVTLKLGTAESADGPIDVKLDLIPAGRGLAYLCEPSVEGRLLPCRVVYLNSAFKDDPRVIRVGLWLGEAQIGRMGRQFMISCRYSTLCKIEFIDPWFERLTVALLFTPARPDRWADVIKFATPEIEKLIRPARETGNPAIE